jgi:DNA polymerase I-like protein with 3'-5' exonuclease and polymerase domains
MWDITIDLETTANGGLNGDSPEAHHPENRVLLWGHAVNNTFPTVSTNSSSLERDIEEGLNKGYHITLIGHNLKFDLKYLLRELPHIPWYEFDLYCTMYGEYRLSGHKDMFVSLEDACAKRGIIFTKTLDLQAILDSGVKMEDIPRSDLEPYLMDDVAATRALHRNQNSSAMLANHALPLASIELNGLLLDRERTKALMHNLVLEEAQLETDLWTHCQNRLEWDDGRPIKRDEIKINAPRTISYLLTGEPAAGLTNGKSAVKYRQGWAPYLGPADIKAIWGNHQPNHLGYPVPEDKLAAVEAIGIGYIKKVVEYRKLQKTMGTYIGPFLELTKKVPTIHPKMNMNATVTGRLSSSQPNGQNMPDIARKCFISEHGQLYEIDFKQLEMYSVAAISDDHQLIDDLHNGVDIHYKTGCDVMGWQTPSDMTEEGRRAVKAVNFGLLYGGGANSLARTAGLPVKIVKDLIKAFYARYKRVAEWQKEFFTEVTQNLTPAGIEEGEQIYESLVRLPISERLFYFKERKSPKWLRQKTGRKYSFKPTETKNYPVQGFAGGDIVMDALVLLYEIMQKQEYKSTKLRMSVHDSILVDTKLNVLALSGHMDTVCRAIETRYQLPFKLEFDIKSGKHWK